MPNGKRKWWPWLLGQALRGIADAARRFWAWLRGFTPPPSVAYLIPDDPAHVPTGPNLVKNPSFELGNFTPGANSMLVSGTGIITDWRVLAGGNVGNARWLDASHPTFSPASDGARFVDLTGGLPPSPTRKLAVIHTNTPVGFQPGNKYEVALDIGIGPFESPLANYGPPVKVIVDAVNVVETFLFNPDNPADIPASGLEWKRFSFRIAIPFAATVGGQSDVVISGNHGQYFIGVDNVSVHLLT